MFPRNLLIASAGPILLLQRRLPEYPVIGPTTPQPLSKVDNGISVWHALSGSKVCTTPFEERGRKGCTLLRFSGPRCR